MSCTIWPDNLSAYFFATSLLDSDLPVFSTLCLESPTPIPHLVNSYFTQSFQLEYYFLKEVPVVLT